MQHHPRIMTEWRLLLALVATVVCAVAAHHFFHAYTLFGEDTPSTLPNTVVQLFGIIVLNWVLAVLLPDSSRSRATRMAGVACLLAFAASYYQMLFVHLRYHPRDMLQRTWLLRSGYLTGAVITGTVLAAANAGSLIDAWTAARCVHLSHAILYLLCLAYASVEGTEAEPLTLPPRDTPRVHAPLFIALHVALAAGLTPERRRNLSSFARCSCPHPAMLQSSTSVRGSQPAEKEYSGLQSGLQSGQSGTTLYPLTATILMLHSRQAAHRCSHDQWTRDSAGSLVSNITTTTPTCPAQRLAAAQKQLSPLHFQPAGRDCISPVPFQPAVRDCISQVPFQPSVRDCISPVHFQPVVRDCSDGSSTASENSASWPSAPPIEEHFERPACYPAR